MMIAAIVLALLASAFLLFDFVRTSYVSFSALGMALLSLGVALFFIAVIHYDKLPSGL